MKPVVVKVGGSLYDLPDLGHRLNVFLSTSKPPILIVPGGGPTADVVRDFDQRFDLGPEASHWMALHACSLNGRLLASLLNWPLTADLSVGNAVVDLFAVAVDDERRPDHWPHDWDVTSDSMAVRVAKLSGAERLVLLKSTDRSAADLVDSFFSTALAQTPGLEVVAIDFRHDQSSPAVLSRAAENS